MQLPQQPVVEPGWRAGHEVRQHEGQTREVSGNSILKGCGPHDLALLSQMVLMEASGIPFHS